MYKALFLTATVLSLQLSLYSEAKMEEPLVFTEEDEALITDRDKGSREKPNLYDYNRQNVQYNRRFDSDNGRSSNSYSNDRVISSDRFSDDNSYNRSYIQDNTSPYLYRD